MVARMNERILLPLFPLPNVLLLPETTLPLHVFEPRYRTMLADALSGDRVIGIQLLNPAAPPDGAGRPAVFEIGCAGEIVRHEPLEDGRSNILLRGTFRYRIAGERETPAPYRMAEVDPLAVRPLPATSPGGRTRRHLRRPLAGALPAVAALRRRLRERGAHAARAGCRGRLPAARHGPPRRALCVGDRAH